ncbi:MAG: hypothetical protein U5J99_14415 [Parvularculaceae bacterium]|nr:hypothetical protein [Parvularculaceae bacterium]
MTPARWRPRLAATLADIASAAENFDDEWWVIGSAAAALSGADIASVGDVDVLLSENDARRLLGLWSAAPRSHGAPDAQFRSAVFARFEKTPLAIEAFGGFEMRVRGRWRAVLPLTREGRGGVFTPSLAEQIAILEAMDREKDRARIAALRRRL